jgi:hypothetical protein
MAKTPSTPNTQLSYPNSKSFRCASAPIAVDPGTSPVEILSGVLTYRIAGRFLCVNLHRAVG